MRRKRGVPDRRHAGLAIGLIRFDDEQAFDRLPRRDKMWMFGWIAQCVKHQDGVRHRRIDGAETVDSVEALGDEGDGRLDRAAARGFRKARLGQFEKLVDRAEELDPAPGLVGAFWPVAHLIRRRGE